MAKTLTCYRLFRPILTLLLFLPISDYCLAQPIHIGFIVTSSKQKLTGEEHSAFHSFSDSKSISLTVLEARNLMKTPKGNRVPDILWYHRSDSSELGPAETSERFISGLKSFVMKGGNLVLTLDAIRLLPLLGVEDDCPSVSTILAHDEGYSRRLGFHAFRNHPLFDSLHGGAYLFSPGQDMPVRRMGWFGGDVPKGKTIAVDWAYINLLESSKLVTEYQLGKGKILAIGAYILFGETNQEKKHLLAFMRNCFRYLKADTTGKACYWDYSPTRVQPFVPLPDSAIIAKPMNWLPGSEEMTLKRKYSTSEAWDLAGEAILVMGKEQAGIDEIWSHPFMAVRDYQSGVLMDGTDSISWLKNQQPEIEVRPESFTRIYRFGRAYLREVISCHPTEASVAVHYEWNGIPKAQLVVIFKSNLRLMWPYSEKVNPVIEYAWDAGINAFCIRDKKGEIASIVGANKKPFFHMEGQYASIKEKFSLKDEKAVDDYSGYFEGTPTEQLQMMGLLMFSINERDRMDLVISASATNEEEALNRYRLAVLKPIGIHLASYRYYNQLFDKKLKITTPDPGFNEGYLWAIAGTDRFFVNTPGVGRSLVAGYSTTDRGWDGGHKVNGRPGYAWYFGRDGVWSSYALLDYGDFEKVRSVLELFSKYQDLSGKIFHELTTSGVAHYDAADATPLYISLFGHYLRHSGDTAFILKHWPNISKALAYCYATDSDNDGLIENTLVGHGWEEGGTLFGTHTTFYLASCWAEALHQAAYISSILGWKADSRKYASDEGRVLKIMNTDFWNDQQNFFYHGKYKDNRYHPEPDVMATVALGFGQVSSRDMQKFTLEKLEANSFSTDWGVRIIGDNSIHYKPGSYHEGSVWPLFTGWTSLAEFACGRPLQGYSHLRNNLDTYKSWSLGYVPEVIHGDQYKPFGVCPHQCWSETMVLQPAISGMLGFKPDAPANHIGLEPAFPPHWDSASVKNIRMGDEYFDLVMQRTPGKEVWKLSRSVAKKAGTTLRFRLDLPLGTRIHRVLVNGREYEPEIMNTSISMSLNIPGSNKDTLRVEVFRSGGISAIPVISPPLSNNISEGYRILSESLDRNQYTLTLNGRSGKDAILSLYAPRTIINAPASCRSSLDTSGMIKLHYRFPDADSEYVTVPLVFTIEY